MEDFKEEWKDLLGAEGIYKISNTGRILSLNYGRKGFSKELQTHLHDGYFYITLKIKGRRGLAFIDLLRKLFFLIHKTYHV